MCGRFTMSDPRRILAEFSILEKHPSIDVSPAAFEPRYNIAPSQGVWVVRVEDPNAGPRLDLLRWGLSPGGRPGPGMPMVRLESVTRRAPFSSAVRSRRCLFVADGFYEWRRSAKKSFPYYVRRPDGAPFAMAGIWQHAGRGDGPALDTCAIITRPARPPVDSVHDRMPVILSASAQEKWLDPAIVDLIELEDLLAADPSIDLMARPVGPHVNSPAHDDPGCVEPATDAERKGEQFDLWPAARAR